MLRRDALDRGLQAPRDGRAGALGGGSLRAGTAPEAERRRQLAHQRVELGLGTLGRQRIVAGAGVVDLRLQLADPTPLLVAGARVDIGERSTGGRGAPDQLEAMHLLVGARDESCQIVDALHVPHLRGVFSRPR